MKIRVISGVKFVSWIEQCKIQLTNQHARKFRFHSGFVSDSRIATQPNLTQPDRVRVLRLN
jgi:hypothetical protein